MVLPNGQRRQVYSRSSPLLIVHCGAHKTGTSTLQKGLSSASDALLEQGVKLVDHRSVHDRIIIPLRSDMSPGKRTDLVAQFLGGLRSEHPDSGILLSHESLFSYAGFDGPPERQFYPDWERNLPVFMEAVKGWSVRMVLTIRRQDTFLESIYAEGCQQGYIHSSWGRFLAGVETGRISWKRLADSLSLHAGREKVRLLPFELLGEGSTVYFRRFLETCGLRSRGVPFSPLRSRGSLSTAGFRILRAASICMPGLPPGMRRILVAGAGRLFPRSRYPAYRPMRAADRKHILQFHSDGNRILFSDYLPDWPEDFYSV